MLSSKLQSFISKEWGKEGNNTIFTEKKINILNTDTKLTVLFLKGKT